MALSTPRALYLCFCIAVVPACSDHVDDPTPSSDAGIEAGVSPDPDAAPDSDPSALCGEYARLDCSELRRCGGTPYLEATFGGYDACVARTQEQCKAWTELPGILTTTSDRLACMRAWGAQSCDNPQPPAECAYVRGELAVGGGCLVNQQCGSGYCEPTDVGKCGKCTDRLPDGATCQRRAQCASNRCERGTCAPKASEGDACVGTMCSNVLVCADGVCKPVKWADAGERCDSADTLCNFGTCQNGLCLGDTVAEIGESCAPTAEGHFAWCRDGECDAVTAKCRKRPEIGESCAALASCAGTAVCAAGQCKALSPDVCSSAPGIASPPSFRGAPDRSNDERPAHVRHGRLLGFRD
jgi:hypothetical protein